MKAMLIAPEGLPIPPQKGGSVQIYLSQLLNAFEMHPSDEIVFVSPGSKQMALSNKARIRHVIVRKSNDNYWTSVHHLIKKEKPDVIQIDNRPAQMRWLMHRHPSTPFIINLHSMTFLGPKHIQQQHARETLKRAFAVVCNSQDLARTIRKTFKLNKNWFNQVHVIYPGVDTVPSQQAETPTHQSPHQPMRILFVGRVIQQKGVHIAVEAVRHLHKRHPVKLTIVGRTPPWERAYRKRLVQQAKNLPVQFVGFIPHEQLNQYYQSHDVLICPSIRHEAFGLVNVEAMRHGLPVVASHIGGIPEAVGEGGFLIRDYTNSKMFARAIRKLTDLITYRRLQKDAIHQSQKFTWKTAATSFLNLYQKALGRTKNRKHVT